MSRVTKASRGLRLASVGLVLAALSAAPTLRAADLPTLLVCSYSSNAVYILENGSITWQYSVPGACQDAWLLTNGNVLVAGGHRVVEVTRAEKKVVWEYTSSTNARVEIHACQPLPDGAVLISEGGMKRLIEVGREGRIRAEIPMPRGGGDAHGMTRIARKTDRGTYVACCPYLGAVIEIDAKGNILRTIDANTTKARPEIKWQNIHSVTLLRNGNLLIGTSYGATFFEIDPSDKIVWTLTAADLPAEIALSYAAGAWERENGNLVISAYTSAYPLFEITRAKEVVWKWRTDPQRSRETDLGRPSNVKVIK
jgi:hypothetical protein